MSRPRSRRAVGVALILALAVVLVLTPGAETAPSPSVDVVFSPTGKQYKIHAMLDRELGMARRTVEVAMFTFTSSRLVGSLVKAKRNGAKVRVLMDKRTADKFSWSKHKELKAQGIQVKLVKLKGSGVRAEKYHHKFVVIDGVTVLTGSFNWTVGADEINHENLLRIRHKSLARRYLREFERVWKNRKLAQEVR